MAQFLEVLGNDLASVLKHDFLSKTQAGYFVDKKNTVSDGEFLFFICRKIWGDMILNVPIGLI